MAGVLLVVAAGAVGGVALLPLLLGGAVLAGVGYGYFWGVEPTAADACTRRAHRSICPWRSF